MGLTDRERRSAAIQVRVLTEDETPAALLGEIRLLVVDGFDGEFSDEDWDHTYGGWRVVALDAGSAVSHAAVVPRTIRVGDFPFQAGYVEGVATMSARQREGLGSQVMVEASRLVRSRFALGVLSTGRPGFYERLGWERWHGPTFVRDAGQLVRTPDEDDGILVLRFGPSQGIDLTTPISCDVRSGDDW
jgi:aminoglycoside 2'-N-acetyltransferase I